VLRVGIVRKKTRYPRPCEHGPPEIRCNDGGEDSAMQGGVSAAVGRESVRRDCSIFALRSNTARFACRRHALVTNSR
jgi:hypothetical protein